MMNWNQDLKQLITFVISDISALLSLVMGDFYVPLQHNREIHEECKDEQNHNWFASQFD